MTRCRLLLRVSVLLVVSLAGCIQRTYETVEVSQTPMEQAAAAQLRSATNLPEAFTVLTPANARGDCPPRLHDPQLRTTLTLYASVLLPAQDSTGGYRGVGDYTVEPQGRYGEMSGEALRVDCLRLRGLGIIRVR